MKEGCALQGSTEIPEILSLCFLAVTGKWFCSTISPHHGVLLCHRPKSDGAEWTME